MANILLRALLIAAFAAGAAFGRPAGEEAAGAARPANEKEISFGEEIKIEDHLAKGKTVIVDFFSPFCPPCRRISPLLSSLAAARPDLSVLKVNINRENVKGIDWKSPVARQFGLSTIPFFRIYGPDGKLVAQGDEAFEKIMGWMQEANIR